MSNKSTRIKQRSLAASQAGRRPAPAGLGARRQARSWWMLAGLLGSAFVWSYWPILAQLLKAWRLEPDYSHGFLVVPVALYFLWARRDLRPAAKGRVAWGGLGLVGFALALRLAGGWYYIDSMAA
ncbi:MAG: archaeosortase/exosortase family protein [Pirellulales bacterium]